jgi:hypothetical protein
MVCIRSPLSSDHTPTLRTTTAPSGHPSLDLMVVATGRKHILINCPCTSPDSEVQIQMDGPSDLLFSLLVLAVLHAYYLLHGKFLSEVPLDHNYTSSRGGTGNKASKALSLPVRCPLLGEVVVVRSSGRVLRRYFVARRGSTHFVRVFLCQAVLCGIS